AGAGRQAPRRGRAGCRHGEECLKRRLGRRPRAQQAAMSAVETITREGNEKRRADRPPFRQLPSYHCGGGISFSTWIAATSSEPSGSFGAPATNTFKPGLRSSLVPGTVVAM